jgi:SAM-dependent methyltransferase
MGLYVQYGCGACAPEGWLSFDVSPSLRFQRIPLLGRCLTRSRFPERARYGDIRKGLPVADGSSDAVYCSHVLEHLTLDEFRLALKNTHKLLRKGGTFRMVLPDLKRLASEYLARTEPDASIRFLDESGMGQETRLRGLPGLLKIWLGSDRHMWMWDMESLSMELTKAGFASIRRATFGDSGDPAFAKVEDADRWAKALGIQCLRP